MLGALRLVLLFALIVIVLALVTAPVDARTSRAARLGRLALAAALVLALAIVLTRE
jgi:hypothetical protein